VHDVTDIEQRGIPAGFVATTEFIDAAETQARALGFDPARVFVPHPIQDRTEAEIRAIANNALDEILAMICGPNPASA
jgi:hypothetical protein